MISIDFQREEAVCEYAISRMANSIPLCDTLLQNLYLSTIIVQNLPFHVIFSAKISITLGKIEKKFIQLLLLKVKLKLRQICCQRDASEVHVTGFCTV